jgi:hypothetical protein
MTKDVSLQSGTYGIRAVVHSAWSKEIADFVRREGAVELELNQAKGWREKLLSATVGARDRFRNP